MVTVALDVMGGDNCPVSTIKGAVKALGENKEVFIKLYGPEDTIREELKKYPDADSSRYEIIDAPDTITAEEHPVSAVRSKKNSSICKGVTAVKKGEADAFVSAGSTGAVLAAGIFRGGRIKGVMRSPLALIMPTLTGNCLLLDCGANVDARPEWLCQFARMGAIYSEKFMNVKEPSVKLLNIGTEAEKGNALIKAAAPMLAQMKGINYQGFIESRDIIYGGADVVVTDAFTGNAVLKMFEGTALGLMKLIKDTLKNGGLKTKLGALLIMPSLKAALKKFDAKEHGGAPMLGLNGLVVKCHGNASEMEICNSILECISFSKLGINELIEKGLAEDSAIYAGAEEENGKKEA